MLRSCARMWRARDTAVGVAGCALLACARSGLDPGYVEPGDGWATAGAAGSAASSGAAGRMGSAGGAGGSGGMSGTGGSGGTSGTGAVAPLAERTCATGNDPARFAHGKTHYVGNSPDCEGLTPCYASVAGAVAAAASGDTVMLLPGTYAGVKIRLEDAGPVDLRLTSRDGPATTFVEKPCIQVIDWAKQPGEIWIDHLSFQNCGPHTSLVEEGWGVSIEGYPDVGFRIFDDRFVNAGASGGIRVGSSDANTVMHGLIARNWLVGHQEPESVPLEAVTPDVEGACVRIENNVIAGNLRGAGVGPRSELVNNTLVGNQQDSLGAAAHSVSANNLFVKTPPTMWSPEWGFEYVHPVRGDFHDNLVWSGAFAGWQQNFSADPRFIDEERRDYHLRADSPALGRGAHPEAPITDMEGRLRPNPPSLGALEPDSSGDTRVGWGCGDGIIEWGAFTTSVGTYTGFETCDPGEGSHDVSCDDSCQLRAAHALRMIAAGSTGVCAVRANGELACWGKAAEYAPAGAFRQVTLDYDHGCALGQDGTVTCWDSHGPFFAPAGTFNEIAAGSCALATEGITCWGQSGVTRQVSGEFVHVDESCAVTRAGDYTCWNHEKGFPAGQFLQLLTWDLDIGCGLASDGLLTCTDPSRGPDTTQTLPAGFAQVQAQGGTLVALRPDGRAAEWHPTYVGFVDPDRLFIDAVPGPGITGGCGLTPSHKVYCWPEDPRWPEE